MADITNEELAERLRTVARTTDAYLLQSEADALNLVADRLMGMEWRPIEEAPKDGTEILAWDAHMHRCCIISFPNSEDSPDGDAINPTHFMPLPSPPASKKE